VVAPGGKETFSTVPGHHPLTSNTAPASGLTPVPRSALHVPGFWAVVTRDYSKGKCDCVTAHGESSQTWICLQAEAHTIFLVPWEALLMGPHLLFYAPHVWASCTALSICMCHPLPSCCSCLQTQSKVAPHPTLLMTGMWKAVEREEPTKETH
jgi:hypothetical protein